MAFPVDIHDKNSILSKLNNFIFFSEFKARWSIPHCKCIIFKIYTNIKE